MVPWSEAAVIPPEGASTVNPPAAVQRPAAGPESPPRRAPRTSLLFGVLAVAGVLLVSQLLDAPHDVARLTVDNPTDYAMLVEVSGGQGDGWLPIGTIDRRGPTTFAQLYDVGKVWRFRVSAQTENGGTFSVSRAQLARANWRVRIPDRVGDDLRANGVAEQP
jgi:hypothetical protein